MDEKLPEVTQPTELQVWVSSRETVNFDDWLAGGWSLLSAVETMGKRVAGLMLWRALNEKGEKVAGPIRASLCARYGVNDETLNRWRKSVEVVLGLPPATDRVAAQQARRLNVPPRVKTDDPMIPDEHIPPPPSPAPKPPAKPAKQLDFDFTPRLLNVLAAIRPEWQDAAAARLEGFVEKMRAESGQRSGQVDSRLKKS